jgi:hypothetical protein
VDTVTFTGIDHASGRGRRGSLALRLAGSDSDHWHAALPRGPSHGGRGGRRVAGGSLVITAAPGWPRHHDRASHGLSPSLPLGTTVRPGATCNLKLP